MAKDYAKKFYASKAWRDTQDAYLTSKILCERCGDVACIVHHKTYLAPQNINDVNITLNWDNLEALCQDCHNKEHFAKGGACVSGLRFDKDGNLVKV